MGKQRNPRRVAENEAFAVNRFIRSSPQKLNLVAQMIRGKKVDRALAELTFSRKRISGQVKRTLESAIANAENNHQLDVDSLVVAQAHVGKRLVMKRFHARGRGRASRVEKSFSQLTVVVRETEGEDKKRKGKGGRQAKPAAEASAARED
ncbi:MAG: 50S ribosomal protein L22 [Hyphomicrobiaceae bacterium]